MSEEATQQLKTIHSFLQTTGKLLLATTDFEGAKVKVKDEVVDETIHEMENFTHTTRAEQLKETPSEAARKILELEAAIARKDRLIAELQANLPANRPQQMQPADMPPPAKRPQGKQPAALFSLRGTVCAKDEAQTAARAAELRQALRDMDCRVNGQEGNPLNQALAAHYRSWARQGLVPLQPNGGALYRFLTEDCGFAFEVEVKAYRNFVNSHLEMFTTA